MRTSGALLGAVISVSTLAVVAVSACGEKAADPSLRLAASGFVPQQPGASSPASTEVCAPFGAALTNSNRWSYAVRSRNEIRALEQIEVVNVAGGRAQIVTTLVLGEERLKWSSVVDCVSGKILEQEAPDVAYVFWPFPGLFVGQRLDAADAASFVSMVPSGRRGRPPRTVELTYRRNQSSSFISRIERQTSGGQSAQIDFDSRVGATAVHFADGSSVELISENEAASLSERLGEGAAEGETRAALRSVGAPTVATAVPGTNDYSALCFFGVGWNSSYEQHWPELAFRTIQGIATSNTDVAGDDLTAQHDDRDSEFRMQVLDDQFNANYLSLGQTDVNVEWESVMMFPKHPYTFYNDTNTELTGNHFGAAVNGLRDISYQSPRRWDQVYVRGAVVVDCGHSSYDLELHPPVAVAWSHKFAPGSADYFLRASSYGWYPHVQSFFTGPNNEAFEADLDIPDASAADPGSTPYLGPVIVDYTYSGYDVSDDYGTDPLDPYSYNHPSAHLFGGDWSQPVSNYFDVSVTLNGSKVHIHAAPKSPWNVPHDNPQRPALIGIHFTACVPRHENGVDLNGCGVQPPYELFGQVKPADLGGTVNGWVAEFHRPATSLKVQVAGFAQCDLRDREGVATTASTGSNHTYSAPLPQQMRICDPRGTDNILEWVVRLVSDDERPQAEEFPLLHRYTAGGCVETPDIVLVSGLCPPGTGVNGGFRSCASPYPTPTTLLPYCEPGRSGQPVLPTVPAGLTATGGPNQITLSWQPNNAIEYEVYSADGAYSRIAGTLANSFTVSGLPNGVTHSYAVSGANSIGEGPASPIATATTLHCSQNCAGCCSGETCNAPSASTGCKINGQACGTQCPAGTDTCSGGACVCHQYDWQVCDTTLGQADYTRTCGNYLNACGAYVSCGTCPPGNYSCTGGISAHCVCTPFTASQVCGACGTYAADGCGGSVYCGACPPPPRTCRAGQRNCDGVCVCGTCQCQ